MFEIKTEKQNFLSCCLTYYKKKEAQDIDMQVHEALICSLL